MSRFTDLLRRTNDRLDLPQPVKSRILLKIASDLDDMYRHFIGQGIAGNEAVRRVEEKFELSDNALRELVQVHESPFRKFLSRFSESFTTTIFGLIMLLISGIIWFVLFSRYKKLTATRE
jgi:hypothetical protein